MNATIKLENVKHFPVLLNEVISIISPLYGGTFIDCTFGQGGYSKKILENNNNKVYALDRDSTSIEIIVWCFWQLHAISDAVSDHRCK